MPKSKIVPAANDAAACIGFHFNFFNRKGPSENRSFDLYRLARSQLSIEAQLRSTPPVRFFHGGTFRGTEEENTSQLGHKTFTVLLRAAPPSAPTTQTLINGGERGLVGVKVKSGRGRRGAKVWRRNWFVSLFYLCCPGSFYKCVSVRRRREATGKESLSCSTEGNKVRRKTLFFCPVGFRGRNYSRPPGFREKTTLRYVLHALLHTYSTCVVLPSLLKIKVRM